MSHVDSAGFITSLRRGDHLIWTGGGTSSPVYIVVTRVARDMSWADLCMFTFSICWTKRMPLPMPMQHVRFAKWDSSELAADAEHACRGSRARHGFAS